MSSGKSTLVLTTSSYYFTFGAMNDNRYLPAEVEDEDILEEEVVEGQVLPVAPVKQPVQVFEMSVWKEGAEQDGVVLSSYVEQLFKDGLSPEEIAKQTGLTPSTVRRKLNQIANSFLGKPDADAKGLRRLEVDEYLTRQLSKIDAAMNLYVCKCTEAQTLPDPQVLTKYQAQLTKLLEVRMKLWGLEGGDSDAKAKGKPQGAANIVGGRIESSIDKITGNKIADFIIGIVNKE